MEIVPGVLAESTCSQFPKDQFAEGFYGAMQEACRQSNTQQAESLAVQMLEYNIREAFRFYSDLNMLFMPPDTTLGYVYLGYSEAIGAYKIGYSANLQNRKRQINSALKGLSLPGDFEMLDCICAPQKIAQRFESKAKNDLLSLRKGGEWFFGDAEPFAWLFENYEPALQEWEEWLASYTTSKIVHDYYAGCAIFPRANHDHATALLRIGMRWHRAITQAGFDEEMQRGRIRARPAFALRYRAVPA